MKKETELHLRKVLRRIEEASQRVLATRGYSRDTARIKILEELLREQLGNENISSTTRQVR